MKSLLVILLIAAASLTSVGCGKGEGDKAKTYDIEGKVVSVDTTKKSVRLDHKDIPGLMKAMEMTFDVQDAKLLEGIKPGDQIHGKLKAKDGSYTILELHKR